MARIQYIGLKNRKEDTTAGTGLVWARAEVHEVADPEKAQKLLAEHKIWALEGSEQAREALVDNERVRARQQAAAADDNVLVQMRSALQQAATRNAQLTDQLATKTSECAGLEARAADLQAKLDEAEKDLDSAEAEVTTLQEALKRDAAGQAVKSPDDMTDDELRQTLRDKQIAFHPQTGRVKLLAAVKEAS